MKQFVIAALLGFISQSDAVQMNSEYRPNPAQSPWAAKSKPGAKNAITGGFVTNAPYYDRVVPFNYTAESDDRLMNSLISAYSTEGNTGGAPNGKFFLTKKNARAVASEVAGTHFGFKGEKKEAWLNKNFDHAYNSVDPLKEGFIPIMKGPVFLRKMVDSVEISNKLQLQLGEEGALAEMGEVAEESEFRPINAVVAPWSAKPKAAAKTPITGAYKPGDNNFGADWNYQRAAPTQFNKEEENAPHDLLMNSLIMKYALEGKTDGAPNGKFYLDKSGMRAVSSEVVGTHFGFKGKKREKFLNQKFPELWANADVNKQGFLVVEKGPPFLRSLLDSVELSNGLQLQIAGDME